MLYFSKSKIIFIYVLIIFLSYFSISNFLPKSFEILDKKINLGLDLQGGSYLLLEIDNEPIILQKLQGKFTSLKKFFKEKNIKFKNMSIEGKNINLEMDEISKEEFLIEFTKKKDNLINT